MATTVGNQTDFIDAMQELIELDYDAIEAYETAINRLENDEYKSQLTDFKMDHQNHVVNISEFLRNHNEEVPTGPSAKQWLTKGKVVLAELVGDNAILSAMLSNEEDTNTAYERMTQRDDVLEDASNLLSSGLQDERRHKLWLESVIK